MLTHTNIYNCVHTSCNGYIRDGCMSATGSTKGGTGPRFKSISNWLIKSSTSSSTNLPSSKSLLYEDLMVVATADSCKLVWARAPTETSLERTVLLLIMFLWVTSEKCDTAAVAGRNNERAYKPAQCDETRCGGATKTGSEVKNDDVDDGE